jgi:hypothetical protein
MQDSPPRCKSFPYKQSVHGRVGRPHRDAGARNFRWTSKRQMACARWRITYASWAVKMPKPCISLVAFQICIVPIGVSLVAHLWQAVTSFITLPPPSGWAVYTARTTTAQRPIQLLHLAHTASATDVLGHHRIQSTEVTLSCPYSLRWSVRGASLYFTSFVPLHCFVSCTASCSGQVSR